MGEATRDKSQRLIQIYDGHHAHGNRGRVHKEMVDVGVKTAARITLAALRLFVFAISANNSQQQ